MRLRPDQKIILAQTVGYPKKEEGQGEWTGVNS
jgi:hypothetical protein